MTRDNSEAQKSPVHEATEDASSEPSNRDNTARRQPGMVDPRNQREGGTNTTVPGSGGPPASNFERGAADRDIELTVNPPGDEAPVSANEPELPAGPGAADSSSGGGAGAGIPGGGTDIRLRGQPKPGDSDQDRRKLFPNDQAMSPEDLPGAHVVSDESDFGGPVKIETEEQSET